MFYMALDTLNMRDAPRMDGAIVDEMSAAQIGRHLDTSADGAFVELLIVGAVPDRRGWVRLGALLKPIEAPQRTDFSMFAFLKACIDAERLLADPGINSSGFFVVADFLIALADIESGISNTAGTHPLTGGTGPFRIAVADWEEFLASPLGADYALPDHEDGLDQIAGAAFLALRAMKAISQGVIGHDRSKGDLQTSGPAGPYVPSYVDVLLAFMLGTDAAIAIRLAKLDNDGGRTVDSVLPPRFTPSDVATLKSFRSAILQGAGGGIETVDGLLLKAEALLTERLRKALDLIRQHIPEDLPKLDGPASWMPVADAEKEAWEATHKDETTPSGRQRVLDYFHAIHFPTTTVEPWCGAFVGFCLAQSGTDGAGTLVKNPAGAASWAQWGNVAIALGEPDPPYGAVVVLAPDRGSGSSGHVGFFREYLDRNTVHVLGGNQSDKVTLGKFARSKIVALRWFSPGEREHAERADVALGEMAGDRFAGLLDFIGKLESNGNYNAHFGRPANMNAPAFTAMTVREVLDWQRDFVTRRGSKSSAVGKYQFLRKTLGGLRDAGVVSNGTLLDEQVQDALALALMKGRGLGKFLAGLLSVEDFGVSLAKEWASLPVPKDVNRGTRLVRKGQSYYAGDGLNKSFASATDFIKVLRSVAG